MQNKLGLYFKRQVKVDLAPERGKHWYLEARNDHVGITCAQDLPEQVEHPLEKKDTGCSSVYHILHRLEDIVRAILIESEQLEQQTRYLRGSLYL